MGLKDSVIAFHSIKLHEMYLDCLIYIPEFVLSLYVVCAVNSR